MAGKALVWTGRVISILVSLVFVMSGVMKVVGGDQVTEGMTHLGLPPGLIGPLAAVEIACVAIYAVPQTAVLGAILLTGYLGGAICAHLRVGDPVTTAAAIGVLVWLGVYLREPRLRDVLPLMLAAHPGRA